MKRKSTSDEENARDLLCHFLVTCKRAPLRVLLELYSAHALLKHAKLDQLLVETEVPTNLRSRADLVVASATHLLFVDVKIDAVEQVGQYEKYKHSFETEGYVVTAGGLVERTRSARSKDNVAFLNELGVRRPSWSQLLDAFQQEFGETDEFKRLLRDLRKIRPTLGSGAAESAARSPMASKNSSLISADNNTLAEFYKELLGLVSPMAGKLWQYGNSPYCLAFGKPSWGITFRESWFLRAFICCQKNEPSEPAFGFGVMLWNRTWTKNKKWFERHKSDIAQYFSRRGFDVGRNVGASWHSREAWLPPYDSKRLKYANAFWSPRLRLTTCDHVPVAWNDLLSASAEKCEELARIIDDFAAH
jgi:hypothetical protein